MKLADKTPKGQTETLEFEFDLAHAPTKVWRAITDPELLSQWLLPVIDLELEHDAAFNFMAPPQPGWDGVVGCRFIEIDPPRKLSYSWDVADMHTVVTFTLTPIDSGTLLTLVQTGFNEEQKRNFGGARYGWRMMGERLIRVLDAVQ